MTPSHLSSFSSPAAPEEIRRQLDKLLASDWFVRSGRMRRFLRFGVEHALEGTGSEIKEYLVGVEVYDRAASYDPRVDPIVRVEARRLRAKLDAYYASAGKNDAVLIKFPKGAYAATCVARTEARFVKAVENSLARIAVAPFTNFSPESGDDYFSRGLTEELVMLLTRVRGLQVMAAYGGREPDSRTIGEEVKAGILLRGSWRRTGVRVRVTAQLIDTKSGAYLWSEVFYRIVEDVVAIQEEIARAIVDKLRLTLVLAPAAFPGDRRHNGTFASGRRWETNWEGLTNDPRILDPKANLA